LDDCPTTWYFKLMDQALKSEIIEFFKTKNFALVIVFGSASTDRITTKSDIDIAIAGSNIVKIDEKVAIINALSKITKREVDLVDLNQVSGPILREILTKGIYLNNESKNLFASLMRKMWYNQADMMPYANRILKIRRKEFLDG
jgi:uncharacterized protein